MFATVIHSEGMFVIRKSEVTRMTLIPKPSNKWVLIIRLRGEPNPMDITFDSKEVAERVINVVTE